MPELPSEIEVLEGEVLVRRAHLQDLADVTRLLSQMHDGERIEPSDGVMADTYGEILRSPQRALLVASLEEQVVGTLDLLVVPNLTHGGQPWAAIENVVVDSSHRRKGVGGILLKVAVELAEVAGCYKLQLVSHMQRDAAHALYRHAGFDAPVAGYRRYIEEGR